MLYEGTRDRMIADGWTHLEDEFRIGEILLDEGVICSWSDYEVASDHGQFFGWASITAETARSAQSYLVGEGWLRENAPDGVYITENPSFAFVVDDDGYGMTYFFGDGWVMLADVRQNLALIDWQG
ncbi:hypothetical protein [Microbacterium sp. NIBRBAC000506063]|uniref:hypothetical protein n=1 Tax=Microbacterium sp. NIBRBAC000506063 TaxID=2734618 RepID=UPI001BB57792|nr:hypothetical protein [Microbacterium sp. NIBRBAC000506063]QTV79582.1 hypothetical protein KAE78_12140 [Microbacterium sp. NIBRBAC000506063]